MNGSYYQTPVFLNEFERDTTEGMNYNMEQSYIENILRNNIGKKVRVHASFSDSIEWRDRVFVGIIERAGRDNLIINDIDNGKYYFELYDDVTVEVLFRKDEIENPNTGDGFLMYIIVLFGLIFMILLAINYFGKKWPKFE